jgi:hypothetical protein
MPKRDRLKEILGIKERSGRRGGRFPSAEDLRKLQTEWEMSVGDRTILASLLPARIVTLIEVFCRYWVQKLIDHGSPYIENSINLRADFKYDFATAQSLQGQTISLGLLISNSISFSSIENIASNFSILLGEDFFQWLSKARYRTLIEDEGDSTQPIIGDIVKLRGSLAQLFGKRHVLVHEFPEKLPIDESDIPVFLKAAIEFFVSSDEGFTQAVYGLYPINQQAMNREAAEKSKLASDELDSLVEKISVSDPGILKVQETWRSFCDQEASRISAPNLGGTIYPLIYSSAATALTKDRTQQLRQWLEEDSEV